MQSHLSEHSPLRGCPELGPWRIHEPCVATSLPRARPGVRRGSCHGQASARLEFPQVLLGVQAKGQKGFREEHPTLSTEQAGEQVWEEESLEPLAVWEHVMRLRETKLGPGSPRPSHAFRGVSQFPAGAGCGSRGSGCLRFAPGGRSGTGPHSDPGFAAGSPWHLGCNFKEIGVKPPNQTKNSFKEFLAYVTGSIQYFTDKLSPFSDRA